jgi:hypothetical protein
MYDAIPTMLLLNNNDHDHANDNDSSSSVVTVFVQGTGALRYDLFQGNVLLDDIIAVCPFNDTIYQVAMNLKGRQLLQVLNLSSRSTTTTQPNDDDVVLIAEEGGSQQRLLPKFAVSIRTIQPNQSYDILTTQFHVADMMERIREVTGSVPPNEHALPQPVANPAGGGVWNTTTVWRDYVKQEWPCWKKKTPSSSSSTTSTTTTTSAVEKKEKPMAAAIFICLIVCGLWAYQRRKQELHRLGYMPIGDVSSTTTSMASMRSAGTPLV